MTNQENNSLGRSLSLWMRQSLFFKLMSIGFITLLLLIPKVMIQEIIGERQYRQEGVMQEISASWGGAQTVTGPILSIPYSEEVEYDNGKTRLERHVAYFLPEELKVEGDLAHQLRSRGLFDAILYQGKIALKGHFERPNFAELSIAPERVHWQEARLSVGISGMQGIKNVITLNWAGANQRMEPGTASTEVLPSGVSAPVALDPAAEKYTFEAPLELNGAELFHLEPVGRLTELELRSSWPSPSFSGQFLPENRQLDGQGFAANWRVLDMNRNYPQQWKDLAFKPGEAAFGVRLIRPVDEYLKNDRAAKYAILVIGLTFLIYFFFETLRHFHIHPFQYLLVGLALTVFYLLLLSLSEHLGFNTAYLVASAATLGLIGAYSKAVLRNGRLTALLLLMLAGIYGFIFIILQLEDYALLAGSLGIFAALALVMMYSRKVDWYQLGGAKDEESHL